jgi:two-component system, NtrC family, response regulator AtoC
MMPTPEEPSVMNRERSPSVLLVDDDLAHTQALVKILKDAGYQVSTAGDGHDALTILMQRPFDLVITDLKMPRKSGLDLLRSIRGMSPDIPVVVITGFGEWTTYMQAMNIGAVDYLNKPARRHDILLTIRKALARRRIRSPDISSSDSVEDSGAAS